MFDNVVVGVDGHQGGRDAIALAECLMEQRGALTLAGVWAGDAHPWRGSNAAYDAAERDRTVDLLSAARDDGGITAELQSAGAPSPGRGLHQISERVGADLLVVGSSRRGLFGRVMLGDDTQSALNGAPCAVAIAPAGYALGPRDLREVGVGYNGSTESSHAIAVARELARRLDAKLSAFETVSLPAALYTGGPASIDVPIDAMLTEARERIVALGDVEPHTAYGRPSEELAVYSASLGLLVIGSRDYGPVGRLVHGSTSHQLARTARCPLLVLTRSARARDTASGNGGQHTAPAGVAGAG